MKFEQPNTIDIILTQSELSTIHDVYVMLRTCIDVLERRGYDHISDGESYVSLGTLRDCTEIIDDFYQCVRLEDSINE